MNTFNFGPPPYPFNAFHILTCDALLEVFRNIQAPDAVVGMTGLCVMATSCQGLIVVELPTGQVRPVSLRVMPIAESGSGKSPTLEKLAAPIVEHDAKRDELHGAATASYAKAFGCWEPVHRALCGRLLKLTLNGKSTEHVQAALDEHIKREPTQPRLRQFMRLDMSARALVDALQGDGESIAWMAHEGDVVLRSDAFKQLGVLNSIWDSSPLSLDRANGVSVRARNAKVCINIMPQPTAFKLYMKCNGEQARGTGHLARFLVGWPSSTMGTCFTSGEEQVWTHLLAFHDRVRELLRDYDRRLDAGHVEPAVIKFTSEAKVRWIRLVNEIEWDLGPSGKLRDIADHAKKSRELVGRVAAVLHHFADQPGDITVDTLERAIAIVGWHVAEFHRIFTSTSEGSRVHRDAEVLARHLHEDVWLMGNTAVPRNDVLHEGPVRPKRRFAPALQVLIQKGLVAITQEKSGRRWVNLNSWHFNSMSIG